MACPNSWGNRYLNAILANQIANGTFSSNRKSSTKLIELTLGILGVMKTIQIGGVPEHFNLPWYFAQ